MPLLKTVVRSITKIVKTAPIINDNFAYFFDFGMLFSPRAFPTMALIPNETPNDIIYNKEFKLHTTTYVAVYFTSKYPDSRVIISKVHHSAQIIKEPGIASFK